MKKTLFIGLGGCGLETVSQLSKKPAAQENDDAEYMFLYVDTDEKTKARINMYGEVITNKDFINLGSTNPYQVYDQATKGNAPRQKRILEWASSQEKGHITFPNRSLAEGAMAQRMVGRMGLAQFAEAIKTAITNRLAQFQNHKDAGAQTVDADIWVVASSCGGTGSSLTLDVLYLINKITNEKLNRDAFVKLVLFMPEPFIEHNRVSGEETNHHSLNGYSFMWELNAFKQHVVDGGKDIFAHFSAFPWGYNPGEQYDFCRFVIPVDVETNRSTKIGMNNIYATTAEMMYYLNVGAGAQKIVSNLCNDIVTASNPSSALTQFNDTPFKWGTWLVPYGYHVIRKADYELKDYLKKRATFEILRYGLLGDDMPNDPKYRDEAKKAFAKDYIIPYLMEMDGVLASEDESVRAAIEEDFKVGVLRPDGLDANRVNGFIRKVDEGLDNPDAIKNEYMEKIKKSINKGIGDEVAKHGLQHTWTLLHNVDDFYLTFLNSQTLAQQESENEQAAATLRANLVAFANNGINKRNAAAVAQTGKKYFEAKKELICLKIVRSIIRDLTESPDGYLEIVRRGNGVDRTGLQKLKGIVMDKAEDAESAYSELYKSFIDSQNDALTVYLPSLVDIANGVNGTWAVDNEFERLYHSSIIDYDHDLARGVSGIRRPVRNNPGTNNLSEYIQQLLTRNDTALFVNLALADPVRAQHDFEAIITEDLSAVIDAAIATQGTPVDTWLKRTLEEYISLNERIINFDTLTNPDLIPVLYPLKAAHTVPSLTRYLYVGASQDLAQRFGFMPNSDNSEFVEDKNLSDRFQVIKLPVGLDFYSYKYFNIIQDHYYNHRENVLSEQEGCHIHKAFRFLDLDKALAYVSAPTKLEALRYFLKNLYYQHLVNALKENESAAYRELMGIFDVFGFGASQDGSNSSDALDLSNFLGGAPASGYVDLGTSSQKDSFINVALRLVQPLGMEITMSNYGIDTSKHLFVDSDYEHFELTNVTSPTTLADGLLSSKSKESNLPLMSMLRKVDNLEEVLKGAGLSDATKRVREKAISSAMALGNKQNPNFANLLDGWIKRNSPDDSVFLNEIRQFFNNIIR